MLLFPLVAALVYKYGGLKRIFLLKNITVAVAWAIPITFMPVLSESSMPAGLSLAFFSFFALRAFVNAVAYDIKDVKGDARFAINTMPVKIGIPKTKLLLFNISIFAGCLAVYFAVVFSSISILFISMITAYNIFYIHRIGKTEIKFLSDFIMDGEFIVMGFLAYLGYMLVA
ncbi:MAG: 4-hydroxybenzoate polyprenyltransferase [Candidatus Nitrosomirales archaeon]|jgi:4-hydroxybenzoate polyprenyltransferase